MYNDPRFLSAGDKALVVEFGDAVDPDTNRRVHTLARVIGQQPHGIIDLIPTYSSLLVQYDPMQITLDYLKTKLSKIVSKLTEQVQKKTVVVHIPTLYDPKYGIDLEAICKHSGLAFEDVIDIHSGTEYLVYMMGFTPGFPYLGGVSEKLAMPRLEAPRVKILAGSVGIAERQTGIYPVDSPGGWNLIGRTPVKLFDLGRDHPSLLTAGDYVKFVPLSTEKEYVKIQNLVESGRYEVTITTK